MLATLLVPWPRPRLSSDRAAIASPSRCCLLISNASCGLGGFACAAHAVRKMSLPSPQSRRTYAGLRSWSLDRHQRPMHVLRSRCHVSVPFDQRHRSAKERMVRTLPRDRGSSLAAIIAAFCNNICQKRTHALQHCCRYERRADDRRNARSPARIRSAIKRVTGSNGRSLASASNWVAAWIGS